MPKKVIPITKGKLAIKKVIRGNTEYIYVVEKAKKPKKVKVKKPIKKIEPSLPIPKPKTTIPIPKVEEVKVEEKKTIVSRPLGKSLPPQEIHSIARLIKKFQKFLNDNEEILKYVRRCVGSDEELKNLTDTDIKNILEKKAEEGDDKARKYLEKYNKLLLRDQFEIKDEIKRVEEITGEPFIKEIYGSPEPYLATVGYLGLQEKGEQHYIIEASSDYLEKTLSLYNISYPSKEETKKMIIQYVKSVNPNLNEEEIEWFLKYVYPLEEYGVPTIISELAKEKDVSEAWEELLKRAPDFLTFIDNMKKRMPDEWEKLSEIYGSDYDVEKYLREIWVKERDKVINKYKNTLEDPEKARNEIYDRIAKIVRERLSEEKVSRIYEELKKRNPIVEKHEEETIHAIKYFLLNPEKVKQEKEINRYLYEVNNYLHRALSYDERKQVFKDMSDLIMKEQK